MKRALIISIIYLIFGVLWIYFSDLLVLNFWGDNAEMLTHVQNWKGYFFVAISALLIGLLIYLSNRSISRELYKMDSLLSGSTMGILRINSRGGIVDVSNNLKGIIGYAKGDLQHKDFKFLLADTEKPRSERILQDLKKGNIHAFRELNLVHKSGQSIPVRLSTAGELKGDDSKDLTILVNDLTLEQERESARIKNLELFEQVFKHVPVLLTIYDPEVNEVRVNDEFEEVLGWTNEEIGEVDIMKKLYPDDKYRKATQEWMAIHDAGWKEFTLFTKSGEKRVQEWSNIHLTDDTIVGIGVDITDLKKKERELRDSKELFEGIFNTAQVGMCLTDRDGYFKMVNEEYCSIYGYEPEELIGNRITIILPEEMHEEALEVSRKIVDGEMEKPPKYWQVLNKEGELLDILVDISVLKVGDEKMQITSVMDMTEQKSIQRELEQSRMRLKTAQKIAKIGYWELDLTTNQLFWEDEVYRIWDVSPDEFDLSFEKFYNTIHPDDRASFDVVQEKALAGEKELNFEHRIVLPDGSVKWVLERGYLVENEQGENIRLEGAVQDITEQVEAEEQIRFQAYLLRAVGQAVIVTDMEGKIIYWNKAAENIYQWKKEEVLGKSITDVTVTDQGKEEAAEIMNQLFKGETWSGEFNVRRKDDTEIPTLITNSPVFDKSGNLSAIIGISVDISERKQKEQELQALNQRLSAIANNIPGAVFRYKLYSDGTDKVLYLSKGAKLLWGLSTEEAMGDNQLVWQQIHPDDIDQLQAEIAESGETLSDWNSEWRNVKPDGSIRWHQGLGTPRKVEDGIIWDSIILDITDRKKAELQLKEREEYLRILMDNASDAILASDANGKMLFYNDKLKEWIGVDIQDLPMDQWPDEYGLFHINGSRKLKTSELSLAKVLKNGEIKNYEYIIKGKDGKVRMVETNGSAMYDSEGEKIGAMVVIRDITERLKQEEKNTNDILEALEKERSEIAREIHDSLTQKLSISSMNMKNLAHDLPSLVDEVKYNKSLKFLKQAIEESRSISHRIMPPAIHDFGLVAAIEDMVDAHNEIGQLNFSISYNKEERFSDELEINLYRVVQEAINNIQNHSQAKNANIVITISPEKLFLKITDDGVGFDMESRRTNKKGIGLRTMRSRILKLKGSIVIESSPHEGTTITIEVPVKSSRDE